MTWVPFGFLNPIIALHENSTGNTILGPVSDYLKKWY